jgi:hypothetical protein
MAAKKHRLQPVQRSPETRSQAASPLARPRRPEFMPFTFPALVENIIRHLGMAHLPQHLRALLRGLRRVRFVLGKPVDEPPRAPPGDIRLGAGADATEPSVGEAIELEVWWPDTLCSRILDGVDTCIPKEQFAAVFPLG